MEIFNIIKCLILKYFSLCGYPQKLLQLSKFKRLKRASFKMNYIKIKACRNGNHTAIWC